MYQSEIGSSLDSLVELDLEIAKLLVRRSRLISNIKDKYPATAISDWEYECQDKIIQQMGDFLPHEDVTEPINFVWNIAREHISHRPSKIACLGPTGTFSHITALRLFAGKGIFQLFADSSQIVDAVSNNECTFGLVPIKNSRSGTVFENLELLDNAARKGIHIKESHEVLVELSLMGLGKTQDIRFILSHPHAINQCRRSIERMRHRIPHEIRIVETLSTSDAARLVSLDLNRTSAAIVHQKTGDGYGLSIHYDPFEDNPDTSTTFVLISKDSKDVWPPNARELTSLVFRLKDQGEPGTLVNALSCLSEFNLTSVQSWSAGRDATRKNQPDYLFYVELEGDGASSSVSLDAMTAHCALGYPRILGTYLRPDRVEGLSFRNSEARKEIP